MTQALYAHMNNKRKRKKKKNIVRNQFGVGVVLTAFHNNREERTCIWRTVSKRAERWPSCLEIQVLVPPWGEASCSLFPFVN
jgi:hypothetical protein